ncbi:hypothetical protein ACYPKM_02245 [Pseudomonas aeruginosa]
MDNHKKARISEIIKQLSGLQVEIQAIRADDVSRQAELLESAEGNLADSVESLQVALDWPSKDGKSDA